MSEEPPNSGAWKNSTDLARAILHVREERRKWMFRVVMVPLLMVVLGVWIIDGWLAASMTRFLLWWMACAGATLVVMLFALYDALAVVREERAKHR